ncbi:MAG: hypothetical protein ACJA1Z_002064, partial [Patiriisocius sp.]
MGFEQPNTLRFLLNLLSNRYICKKQSRMLKAGVIGAGHLGKIHLKLLKQSTQYEL